MYANSFTVADFFYLFSGFINFAVCILAGVFVLRQNIKDQKNVGFFAIGFFVAGVNLFYFLSEISPTYSLQYLGVELIMAFTVFVPAAVTHFVVAITGNFKKRKWWVWSNYLLMIPFCVSVFTKYFTASVHSIPELEIKSWFFPGPLFHVFLVIWTANVFISLYFLIASYRSSAGVQRKQIGYVFIGVLTSYIAGSSNFLLSYGINIPPVLNLFDFAYILLIGYAITRYHLLDIRIVARKFFQYVGISVFTYLIFYLICWLYMLLFGTVFSLRGYIVGVVIAPAFIWILYRFNDLLQYLSDRYVFHSLYSYEKALDDITAELTHYIDFGKISNLIFGDIVTAFKLDKAALLGHDEKDEIAVLKYIGFDETMLYQARLLIKDAFENRKGILSIEEITHLAQVDNNMILREKMKRLRALSYQLGVSLYVPLVSASKVVAILVLGDKFLNEPYSKQDLNFLKAFSYNAGIALDNAELYKKADQKNKNLQELISAKNDFIRIANHQLNTPLSIMKYAYSMVENKSMTPKEGMKYWGVGLKRMSRVVEDFWSTFESDSGIHLQPKATDIVEMVNKITDEKRKTLPEALEKKVKIVVAKEIPESHIVWCDSKKIESVINNLLDNAIFYSPVDGIVTVSYEKMDKFFKVNIKDQGIGFSKEDKEKVGQRFFRAKSAILSQPDGSGLGIYICKKILEASKGQLLFSSPGEHLGSTFSFTLPIYENL